MPFLIITDVTSLNSKPWAHSKFYAKYGKGGNLGGGKEFVARSTLLWIIRSLAN